MDDDLFKLGETNCVSPDYLIVQCWVCYIFFHVDTIDATEPYIYCYTKFLEGAVGYNPLGIPCTLPMVIINYSNIVLPFIVTAFPVVYHFCNQPHATGSQMLGLNYHPCC